ncbi:MAG: enoyl-CoA hydratase/isomerase family protein [Acidobacteria bacterium]|nr:enoyl-CoA hydratase/isomerase family protein [Acidobacteriota bacterium]
MTRFSGQAISWEVTDGIIELALHREPCNEFGSQSLAEFEKLVNVLPELEQRARALVIYSPLQCGFSAGADLRETYYRTQQMDRASAVESVRESLKRTHEVMNTLDSSPLTTIAAVHGVTFGGGLELALTCDFIIADKTARFSFPELRLGLIPGFGGIPRLKRDLGNAVVRDLVLTGRSFNATKAHAIGLAAQVVGEGQALTVARSTARQLAKFDHPTSAAAKQFIKPIPYEELRREIDLFCNLFCQPAVERGLKKFVESKDAQPYLP